MSDERCETCRFWKDQREERTVAEDDYARTCMEFPEFARSATVVFPANGLCRQSPEAIPKEPEDWCGEWEEHRQALDQRPDDSLCPRCGAIPQHWTTPGAKVRV